MPSLAGLTALKTIIVYGMQLNQAAVDAFLVDLDNLVNGGGGQLNGLLQIQTNAAPSSIGLDAATDLINNFGWSIIHD